LLAARFAQEARRGGTEEKAGKHAERLFKMIDIDGDGNLTENEFLRVTTLITLYISVGHLRAACRTSCCWTSSPRLCLPASHQQHFNPHITDNEILLLPVNILLHPDNGFN
jgi:hypothetical protein